MRFRRQHRLPNTDEVPAGVVDHLRLLRPHRAGDGKTAIISVALHRKSLTDSIDTKTPAGRFFFHVMASLAQMERELIVERTRAGLEAARQQGRVGGRKRLMTDKKLNAAKKLLGSGTLPQEVAQNHGISVPTLYLPLASCIFRKLSHLFKTITKIKKSLIED